MLPTSWLRRSYVLVMMVSPTRGRWLSAMVRLAGNGRGAPAPLSTEDLTAYAPVRSGRTHLGPDLEPRRDQRRLRVDAGRSGRARRGGLQLIEALSSAPPPSRARSARSRCRP